MRMKACMWVMQPELLPKSTHDMTSKLKETTGVGLKVGHERPVKVLHAGQLVWFGSRAACVEQGLACVASVLLVMNDVNAAWIAWCRGLVDCCGSSKWGGGTQGNYERQKLPAPPLSHLHLLLVPWPVAPPFCQPCPLPQGLLCQRPELAP